MKPAKRAVMPRAWLIQNLAATVPADLPDHDLAEHAHAAEMLAAAHLGVINAGEEELAAGTPADAVEAATGEARAEFPKVLAASQALRAECEQRAEARIAALMDECAATGSTWTAAVESLRGMIVPGAKGTLSDEQQQTMDRALEATTASLKMLRNYLSHAGPEKSTVRIRELSKMVLEMCNAVSGRLRDEKVDQHTQDIVRRLGDESRALMAATAGWEMVN